MVRMSSRILFFLIFAVFGVPTYLLLNHSDEGHDVSKYFKNILEDDDLLDFSYGVIMDAGSTGTRVFLYKWTSNSDEELISIKPAIDEVGKPVVKKVSPGLSSFSGNPSGAADYIKPLLDYTLKYIPEEKRAFTPVFLFATAGMRLLPEEKQTAILHDLHSKLPELTPMQIMKEHIRVIDGKWEGIYSWVAVNYILGKFDRTALLKEKAKSTSDDSRVNLRKNTVGMIDIGGASCQIAFELPVNSSFVSENMETINLGSREDEPFFKYKLFVTTFLGYGVNEGLRKYEQHLSDEVRMKNYTYVRDECMPVNLQKTVSRDDNTSFVRKGIGQWASCVSELSELLSRYDEKKTCKDPCFFGSVPAPTISLSDMEIYGFSEFWYSVQDVLALGGEYNYTRMENKANQFCSQRWSSIQASSKRALYPKADSDRLRSQCFKSAWITAVLHSGFSVKKDTNHFKSALTISGQEVQWALGAMIYHMRFFPLKNRGNNLVVNKHPVENSAYPPIPVIVLLATCAVICLFYIYTTLSSNPRTAGLTRNNSIWSYKMLASEESSTTFRIANMA